MVDGMAACLICCRWGTKSGIIETAAAICPYLRITISLSAWCKDSPRCGCYNLQLATRRDFPLQVYGHLDVERVAGNFHISVHGQSYFVLGQVSGNLYLCSWRPRFEYFELQSRVTLAVVFLLLSRSEGTFFTVA